MAFRYGNLELNSNLFLSPLAGYTNLPFRLIIREIGGTGLCTTDLVNARSLLERNKQALQLIQTCAADHPLAVQLFGTIPEEMRDATVLLESKGVNSVDVNMGCPVRKVCANGAGSALMTDVAKAANMVKAMVDAVKIPVTCKMRLGWDDDNITSPDLARALEDVGVAAIIVHGRTRAQGFTGSVNRAGIRAVVQAVKHVPVIGNGDITSPRAAKRMFDETGCAGISVGRGAFYNPWIFRHIQHFLATGEEPADPGLEERLNVMRRHLDLMVEVFGENVGCRMFRKIATEYTKRIGPAGEFNRRVVRLSTRAELEDVIAVFIEWRKQFLDENNQLRPRYVSRIPEPATTVAVPQGPNELW